MNGEKTSLREVHPGMKRYLVSGCPTGPCEVLTPDGLWPAVYPPETEVSVIARGRNVIACVTDEASQDGRDVSQILIFALTDDGSEVADAVRIDATENNRAVAARMAEEGLTQESRFRTDSFGSEGGKMTGH